MGIFTVKCPGCGMERMWFSGDRDQRCGMCKRSAHREAADEITSILNSTATVKVKRALLRDKLGLSETTVNELCPMSEVTY